jgi:hypothetical protein
MRLLPRAESYAPQTKILQGLTKDEIHIFDVLFNGSYPKYSTRALKKCVENPNFLFCQSFQNLRLGGIKVRLFFDRHNAGDGPTSRPSSYMLFFAMHVDVTCHYLLILDIPAE